MNVPAELRKLRARLIERFTENKADTRRNSERMVELLQERDSLREGITGITKEIARLEKQAKEGD